LSSSRSGDSKGDEVVRQQGWFSEQECSTWRQPHPWIQLHCNGPAHRLSPRRLGWTTGRGVCLILSAGLAMFALV
jgi:hypothetical protein